MKNEVNNTNHIGTRIRAARKDAGFSQLALAQALGFQSATAISLIENGERGIPTDILQRLGEVLHRDTKYFLGQGEGPVVDVQYALRADKELTKEDKEAIARFIELAKSKNKAGGTDGK